MKIKFRGFEPPQQIDINDKSVEIDVETKRVEIQIGESTYLLSESLGRLNINKSDGDNICIHPRYANVVELS
jgi:hypothetical protein